MGEPEQCHQKAEPEEANGRGLPLLNNEKQRKGLEDEDQGQH